MERSKVAGKEAPSSDMIIVSKQNDGYVRFRVFGKHTHFKARNEDVCEEWSLKVMMQRLFTIRKRLNR